MEFQYFSGDCRDPAVQLEAKKAFLRAFDLFLKDNFPDYCELEQTCTVENVQVICGQKQPVGNGRKRGIPGVCKVDTVKPAHNAYKTYFKYFKFNLIFGLNLI